MNLRINAVKCIDFFWNVSANNETLCLERNIRNNLSSKKQKEGGRYVLDSHADTSCAMEHVRIMEVIENRSCDVYLFN